MMMVLLLPRNPMNVKPERSVKTDVMLLAQTPSTRGITALSVDTCLYLFMIRLVVASDILPVGDDVFAIDTLS